MSYFHYQPTFYHIHVHFVHVDRTMRDSRENVSLDAVIANIEMVSDYYQRATLAYKVGTETPLFKILVEHGVQEPEPVVVEEEVKKEEGQDGDEAGAEEKNQEESKKDDVKENGADG